MIKVTKFRSKGCVQLPDTFLAFTQAKKGDEVDVHFGSNFGVIIITAKNVNLSRDNQERIRILTDVKQ